MSKVFSRVMDENGCDWIAVEKDETGLVMVEAKEDRQLCIVSLTPEDALALAKLLTENAEGGGA